MTLSDLTKYHTKHRAVSQRQPNFLNPVNSEGLATVKKQCISLLLELAYFIQFLPCDA